MSDEQRGGDEDELRRRLTEAESRFRSFLATAADWCWESDAEGRLTWLSRDTAMPHEQLLGRLRWEVAGVDPAIDPAWRTHLDDLRAGRPFRDFRYSWRRSDGSLLHVSISGDPVLDPGGRILAWRGTGRDVSAEVEAAARLDDSRSRLAAQIRQLGRLAAEDPLPEEGLNAALAAIVAAATEAFDVRYASIWLNDRATDEIYCEAAWDRALARPVSRPRVRRPGQRASLERTPIDAVIAVEDVESNPFVQDVRDERLRPLGIGALLDAAIWRDGKLVGNFVLSHVGGRRSWTAEERSLAGSLAAYVARTLEAADRLAAERALAERESFFSALLESTADGVTVLDAAGVVKFQTPSALRGLALTLGEVLGRNWLEFVQPEDRPAVREKLEEARATGELTTAVGRMAARDGALRSYEFRISDRTAEATIGGVIVNSRDITERLAREQALRHSEERYRVLAEGSVQGLMIVVQGQCAYVNPRFSEITGHSAEDLAGVDPLAAFAPRHAKRLRLSQRRHGGEGQPALRVELQIRRKDGAERWVDCIVKPFPDRHALLVSIYDITELKQKQAALEASERRFRELTEGSLQGVTINQGGRVVYANEALGRIFGYAPDELMARDRWLLVASEDLPRVKQLLQDGGPERFAFRGRHKDGRTLWLECISREIEWDGAPAWQIVIMDVTERRRVEEQLLQAQKMEAVGQLTGGVAHDFNNLLAVILGNLDLIRDAGLLPPPQARMLDSVMAAATRGAELVQSLLAFARRQQLKPERVDINRLVERAAQLFGRALGATIRLDARLAAGLHAAMVDPALLEATLLNLAINARDAMPDGGRLTIETQNVLLGPETLAGPDAVAPGDYVMLAVTDTGTGMAPEVRERAFEPFFTTKEVGKGTGLGLSMVYGFVKQSGGHVRLYSEPDVGTTFKLYFPRATGGARLAPTPEHGQPAGLEGLRVLLVEDDPEVRDTALAMLSSLGCETTPARDGAEALAALRGAAAFDLLLTDVVLPGGLRGPEIAVQALTLRPGLKVVFMSGYAPQAARALAAPLQAMLLSKPFRRAELARALAQAIAA